MEALKELQDLATTRVSPVTAHYAVTLAAVPAPARSVVQTVSVMRVMHVVKIKAVSSMPIPVAMTAAPVHRAKDASVTTTRLRSFAVLLVVELDLLPRRLHMHLLRL
jgi:hypothetical protein